MKDCQINEGENVKFTVKLAGYPEPDVKHSFLIILVFV